MASSTVTITIAAPGVVTWTASGLHASAQIVFTTTSALPTGITAGTTYFVLTMLTADTFMISATLNGSAITTSGSQSGVQTGWTVATRTETVRLFWKEPLMNGDSAGVIDYVDVTHVSAFACAATAYDDMDNYRDVIDAAYLGRAVSTAGLTVPASSPTTAESYSDALAKTAPKNNTKKRMQWTLTRKTPTDSSLLLTAYAWDDEIKGVPLPTGISTDSA